MAYKPANIGDIGLDGWPVDPNHPVYAYQKK
jgi:hypothetical protein